MACRSGGDRQLSKITAKLSLVTLLMLSAVSSVMAEPRLYIALDTSGSMRHQTEWLSASIRSTEETLQMNGAEYLADFSLLGFTDSSDILARGNAAAISAAIDRLQLHGGTEDGFIPLQKIPAERSQSGAIIVLVTNEDRDETIFTQTSDVINALVATDISVHAVLPIALNCGGNKMVALEYTGTGLDKDLAASDCGSDSFKRLARIEYGQIAFATGGTVWFLGGMWEIQAEFGEAIAYELLSRYASAFRADVVQTGGTSPGSPITFDATLTAHTVFDQQVVNWAWDFDGDGIDDEFGPIVAHIFESTGETKVRLSMTDDQQPPVTEQQLIRVLLK